jgi:nicotinamidase/pyrazinamidase
MKYKVIILILISFLACNMGLAQNDYLMVVDVQKQFYENTKMEQRANEMIENINKIIEKHDAQNIIYIKTQGKMLTISFKGIKTEPMTPIPGLDKSLNLVSENIFTKDVGNAFEHNELNDFLQKNNVKHITITGLLAGQCVYKTALGGVEKGLQITVVPEAILGKTAKKKDKAIQKMAAKGVRVASINEFPDQKNE